MMEIEIKTARVVDMLSQNGVGGVLINGQHNFSWMTGGGTNGIDMSREPGAASILVNRRGERFILANNIEMDRIFAEQIDPTLFKPVGFSWQSEKENSDMLIHLSRDHAGGQIVTDIPFTSVKAYESQLAPCRYELTDEEIVRFRELGRDTSFAVDRTIDNITPGMTEIEIAAILRNELVRDQIISVVTLVAADQRIARYRHPVPTENRLEKTLLLVTCAKRRGLIASMSRMISFGRPDDELLDKTAAAAEVNAALIGFTVFDTSARDLYQIAANKYDELGYTDEIDRHHQGGAAGYRTRDWVAHLASIEHVAHRQAFAWNPTITGTKVEDTHILIDGQMECITASDRFPKIESIANGRRIISHGILTI